MHSYVRQGVPFFGSVLLFLCCNRQGLQSFLLFQLGKFFFGQRVVAEKGALADIFQIARMNEGFFRESGLFLHSGKLLLFFGESLTGFGKRLCLFIGLCGQAVQTLLLPLDFELGDGQVFFGTAALAALYIGMQTEGGFFLVAVIVIADLLGLFSIRPIVVAVDAALGVLALGNAVGRAGNRAAFCFDYRLSGSICQCVFSRKMLCRRIRLFRFPLPKARHFLGFFKKKSNELEALKVKYDKADVNVERIKAQLEDHQVTLMKDIAMLDKMYQLNLVYFKELSMYILAGRKKLQQVRENDLAAAEAKAKASGLPEDAQAARDLADQCDRFEKKLYDLELTRNISIQMGPQIRLIQSNDTMMAEKIQTTIVNTIPLWKNQMVLALGMAHSQQAMQAERAVTDATNELLRKNAATLKQGTIDIAKESERGVVDIETLQQTNRDLISTLDELNKIRADGKAKRAAAEQELGRIEGELKQKLLEINK